VTILGSMRRAREEPETRGRNRPTVSSRLAKSLGEFPAQFWLLTGGTLIYVIGVDMCYPFETLYLNGSLHIPVSTIGLVIGLAGFAGLPFALLGGLFADRIGRRGLLMVGVCGSITLYVGLALAHGLLVVAIVFTVEAAFGWSMFITATNAMVADLTPVGRRAEAYGIGRLAVNGAMVVGPLIALLFLGPHSAFRPLFITAGGVCCIFLVITALRIKETKPAPARTPTASGYLTGYRQVLHDRRFLMFCSLMLLPLYGFGQIWSTFPVALHEAVGVTPSRWAKLLLVWALGASVLQYPVVRLLRSRDFFLLLAAGSALLGLGLGVTPLVPWGWATFALILVISLGAVLLMPIAATVVAEMAPAELRGRYMGVWTVVYLGGSAIGPTAGGLAISALGARNAFVIVGAAGLCGAVLFSLFRLLIGPTRHRAAEPQRGLEPPAHVSRLLE
jgi:MFS family permease